jgi:transcriptional antiterminator
MDIDNTFIKPVLLFHFGKGKSEIETHEEIVKQYGKYALSLKTINKWFAEFKRGKHIPASTKPDKSRIKLSDEFIIELVNKNPQLTMKELGKLGGVSMYYISRRLRKINKEEKIVQYVYKNSRKSDLKTNEISTGLTDEFITDLVSKNPGRCIGELAKIAGVSRSIISKRISQANINGEKVKYSRKKPHQMSNLKITDEFLIDLIEKNPDFSMTDLAKTAGVSKTTISRRLKNINSCEEKVKYVYKKPTKDNTETNAKLATTPKQKLKPLVKFTDDFLIDMVNKNPELSMDELADLIGTTSRTISRRIEKISSSGGKINYTSKKYKVYISEKSEKSCPKTELTNEYLTQLINENPQLNMKELAKILSISASTVSKRIKQIMIDDDKKVYSKKNFLRDKCKANSKPKLILSEEFLIDMVNQNPGLNLKELAALVETSPSRLSKKIRKINWINAREN